MKFLVPIGWFTVWMSYCCYGTIDLMLLPPQNWKFAYYGVSDFAIRLLIRYVWPRNVIILNGSVLIMSDDLLMAIQRCLLCLTFAYFIYFFAWFSVIYV